MIRLLLKAEADAKEKQLMAERAKADAERREHERQLQIQRDKQAKLEAERKAELERIEAERKAREDAERKAMFSALIKKISIMGKHLIFVAHRETRQDGDDMRYVPLFGGSNYDSLVTELDLVGYMEAIGRKRTITFDPTSRNDGKNTCNLPSVMDVPTVLDEKGNPVMDNDFLTKQVIEPYIQRLKDRIVHGEKYKEVVSLIKSDVEAIVDADTANDFVARIDDYDHVGSSKEMARTLLKGKTDSLRLNWVKGKGYEAV